MSQTCTRCQKSMALCLCDWAPPVSSQIRLVVLQHPQEKKEPLGTACLLQSGLSNSTLKVGFSWPNASKATGVPREKFDPKKWVVLYLGTGVKPPKDLKGSVLFEIKKKELLELAFGGKKEKIDGLVILDGTWSQAKTLWWRNPWLLKLRRGVVFSNRPSLYGKLRKEPRREALSSIEATAIALDALGERPETSQHLIKLFEELLGRLKKT